MCLYTKREQRTHDCDRTRQTLALCARRPCRRRVLDLLDARLEPEAERLEREELELLERRVKDDERRLRVAVAAGS